MLNEFRRKFRNDKTVEIIEHDLNYPLPTTLENLMSLYLILQYIIWSIIVRDLYSEIFFILKPEGIFCNLDYIHSESKKLHQYFRKVMGRTPVNKEYGKRLTN